MMMERVFFFEIHEARMCNNCEEKEILCFFFFFAFYPSEKKKFFDFNFISVCVLYIYI